MTSAKAAPAEAFPACGFVTEFMEQRGWNERQFAAELGWPIGPVRDLLAGKRRISPETARDLGRVFGTSAGLWLGLEHSYQEWRLRSEES